MTAAAPTLVPPAADRTIPAAAEAGRRLGPTPGVRRACLQAYGVCGASSSRRLPAAASGRYSSLCALNGILEKEEAAGIPLGEMVWNKRFDGAGTRPAAASRPIKDSRPSPNSTGPVISSHSVSGGKSAFS